MAKIELRIFKRFWILTVSCRVQSRAIDSDTDNWRLRNFVLISNANFPRKSKQMSQYRTSSICKQSQKVKVPKETKLSNQKLVWNLEVDLNRIFCVLIFALIYENCCRFFPLRSTRPARGMAVSNYVRKSLAWAPKSPFRCLPFCKMLQPPIRT